MNKVVREFPEGAVYAIAKASDTCHQIRADERTNLIAVPAQMNLVFLQNPTAIRALSHDIVAPSHRHLDRAWNRWISLPAQFM